MGKSYTISVIGSSAPEKINEETFREHQCHAMNKLEMAQEKCKMEKRGTPVVSWYAQTKQGCKMLGIDTWLTYVPVQDDEVRHVKTVRCPICDGIGYKPTPKGFGYSCCVCNGSGITKNNHWNKWQEWQLESIRKNMLS
jgi:hypothetical protein